MSDKTATIAIADKNPVVRSGLSELLRQDGRFQVAPAVSSGAAFIELVSQIKVDVGLLGWSLPDMTGGEVLSQLKRRQAPVRVIIYTGERASDVLHQAIKGGARGFISKSDEPAVLMETLSSVARGRVCFPYVDIVNLGRDPLDVLTVRERELLAALANGWSNLQIAARTGISENTVKYHLKNLYDKLGVKNRAMAVAMFVSNSSARS
ncbi:MAG: response regulator transcription factor [Hyphomicrobium sp.]